MTPVISRCSTCAAEVAPGLKVCPSCRALVHSERLKTLAAQGEQAERAGDLRQALVTWREALDLLPSESVQARRVGEKVAALSGQVGALPIVPAAPTRGTGSSGAWWAGLGAIGLLLWKLKFVVVFVLTKLKLLLFGLSKGTTVFSMLASAGVYWTLWGWPFALGVVASIYVHEIGHVAALDRLGIKATPPMFVPGLGALVRMKQYPASVREDAYVGLAGPIWGLAAAVVCFVTWIATGYGLWAALAEWGARINLFNLMPLGSLDGGRGFRALARRARWMLMGLCGAALLMTGEPMLILVLLMGIGRAAAEKDPPPVTDRRAFLQFAVLVIALAALCIVPARMGAHS